MPRALIRTSSLLFATSLLPLLHASDDKPLVRVNVDLVQVDAVVTDSKGRHVTDLKPEEFEILENGKAQRITHFSFIPEGTRAVTNVSAVAPAGKENRLTPPVAPARITREQVKRIIAVVVDDLGLSEESFASVHRALERFVNQQVAPGDLIAIVTTSGRHAALQHLTADKRLLRAAVAKLRPTPNHRPGLQDSDFTCVWFNHRLSGASTAGIQDEDAWLAAQFCPGCPRELDPQLEFMNDHRAEYYGRISIAALRRVVDGLRQLPGRRSILLFSEGVPLLRGQGAGETNSLLIDEYNAFLIHADRSAVVVNTIDPRGLITLADTAEQDFSQGGSCNQARQAELVNTQQLLAEVAHRTGGISIKDDNDLSGAMARIVNDQLGYYLIGYKPSEVLPKGSRDAAPFRKMAIRVTRPGLKVRFHGGLYVEHEQKAAPRDAGHQLVAAIASPFTLPDVRVRLSSRFWDAGPPAGTILDTVLEVDAHDLAFRQDSDGRRKAEFDVLAVIYGSESKPLDQFAKSYTVSLTPAAYERALREGLVQRMELPLKHPGAYQIRGAVRDRYADRMGSATEFVEVPEIARGNLALSGVAISGTPGAATLLKYRPGQTVFYAYQVLNAKPATDGSIHVEVRMALYRDGPALGISDPIIVSEKNQADPKRLVVTNDVRLGKQLPPGDYTLQVTAVDRNAPPARATATQSIDFEVVE